MPSFSRLEQSPVIRALLVYLGASWVVLEAADLLHDALELPDWILPVTIILLLAGLVVVAATALVQSDATTDQREAAGEVPAGSPASPTAPPGAPPTSPPPTSAWARSARHAAIRQRRHPLRPRRRALAGRRPQAPPGSRRRPQPTVSTHPRKRRTSGSHFLISKIDIRPHTAGVQDTGGSDEPGHPDSVTIEAFRAA